MWGKYIKNLIYLNLLFLCLCFLVCRISKYKYKGCIVQSKKLGLWIEHDLGQDGECCLKQFWQFPQSGNFTDSVLLSNKMVIALVRMYKIFSYSEVCTDLMFGCEIYEIQIHMCINIYSLIFNLWWNFKAFSVKVNLWKYVSYFNDDSKLLPDWSVSGWSELLLNLWIRLFPNFE